MAQISLGYDQLTGKRIRKTVYGDTQGEVRDKLDGLKEEVRNGSLAPDSQMTVKQFLSGVWLTTHKHSLAERTVERYELDLSYLNTYLGHLSLADLTDRTLVRMYEQMEKDGYSGDARHQAGVRLRQALDYAIQRGYVRRNVAKMVPLPRVERQEMHPMTPEDVQRFLARSEGQRLHALFVVALDSGSVKGNCSPLSGRITTHRHEPSASRRLYRR
jgi:hypothetical protein